LYHWQLSSFRFYQTYLLHIKPFVVNERAIFRFLGGIKSQYSCRFLSHNPNFHPLFFESFSNFKVNFSHHFKLSRFWLLFQSCILFFRDVYSEYFSTVSCSESGLQIFILNFLCSQIWSLNLGSFSNIQANVLRPFFPKFDAWLGVDCQLSRYLPPFSKDSVTFFHSFQIFVPFFLAFLTIFQAGFYWDFPNFLVNFFVISTILNPNFFTIFKFSIRIFIHHYRCDQFFQLFHMLVRLFTVFLFLCPIFLNFCQIVCRVNFVCFLGFFWTVLPDITSHARHIWFVVNVVVQFAHIPGWAIAHARSCCNVGNSLVEPGAEGCAASGGDLAQNPPCATRVQPEFLKQSQIRFFPQTVPN